MGQSNGPRSDVQKREPVAAPSRPARHPVESEVDDMRANGIAPLRRVNRIAPLQQSATDAQSTASARYLKQTQKAVRLRSELHKEEIQPT